MNAWLAGCKGRRAWVGCGDGEGMKGLSSPAQREAGKVWVEKACSRELVEESGCHSEVFGLSLAHNEEPLGFRAGKR